MRLTFLVPPALLAATPAWAEVADKVPSTSSYMLWAIGFNLGAWLFARITPWLGLVALPFALLWSWIVVTETLHAPDIGPAILAEFGQSYATSVWTAIALSLAGPVLIVLFYLHRQTRQS